jgi:hypothetical protein
MSKWFWDWKLPYQQIRRDWLLAGHLLHEESDPAIEALIS